MNAQIKPDKLDKMLYAISEQMQLLEHGFKVDIGCYNNMSITKENADLIKFRLSGIKHHVDNIEKALSTLKILR